MIIISVQCCSHHGFHGEEKYTWWSGQVIRVHIRVLDHIRCEVIVKRFLEGFYLTIKEPTVLFSKERANDVEVRRERTSSFVSTKCLPQCVFHPFHK